MSIEKARLKGAVQIGETRETSRIPLAAFWKLMPPLVATDLRHAVLTGIENHEALKGGTLLKEESRAPSVAHQPRREESHHPWNRFVCRVWTTARIDGDYLSVSEEVWEGWLTDQSL